jgi:hypothetical protein
LSPKVFCAFGVRKKLRKAPAAALFFDVLRIAIGFSIRIVAFGITYGTSWPLLFAKIASFS